MKKKKSIEKIIDEGSEKLKRGWKNISFNFLVIILSISVVIIFSKNVLVSTILLGIISVFALVKWKSVLTLIIYLFFGLIFGIGEIIVTRYQIWTYVSFESGSVPFWLFLLWGLTATFIYQTILEIKKLRIRD